MVRFVPKSRILDPKTTCCPVRPAGCPITALHIHPSGGCEHEKSFRKYHYTTNATEKQEQNLRYAIILVMYVEFRTCFYI